MSYYKNSKKIILTMMMVNLSMSHVHSMEPEANIYSGEIRLYGNDGELNQLRNVKEINRHGGFDPVVEKFGWDAARQAAYDKAQFYGGELKFIDAKDQGYNGLAFRIVNPYDNKEHVVKFARGNEDFKNLRRLKHLWENRGYQDPGVDIPILSHFYTVFFNDNELNSKVNGGKNTWTVQIMNYMARDFTLDNTVADFFNGKLSEEQRGKYLEMIRNFGSSLAKFQRGGKTFDQQNKNKKTFIHGDFNPAHIFIKNNSNSTDFSLVDITTMAHVEDPDGKMLLVDPMFLSSVFLTLPFYTSHYDKKVCRDAIIDIFNNFYVGYLKELSDDTIEKLYKIFENREKSIEAYKNAKEYQAKIHNHMKTSRPDLGFANSKFKSASQQQELEAELANLHRWTFQNAYYEHHNWNKNWSGGGGIIDQQKKWNPTIFKNGL